MVNLLWGTSVGFCIQKIIPSLDTFAEIHKQNERAVLLLIGTGLLEESIREQVHQLRLEDAVIFAAGVRNDVGKMLQAMDVFLFHCLKVWEL